MSTISKDVIYLRNLHLSAVVGDDAWGRSGKSQPVMLSLRLHRNTLLAGSSDDVLDTFSYGQMCKDVTAAVDGKNFHGLGAINSVVGQLAEAWAGESLECQALLPKGLLRVDGGFGRKTVMRRYGPNEWRLLSSQWTVQKIKAACIIGVNSHERLYKQAVSIDVRVPNKEDDLEFDPCSVENHKTWRTVAHETLQTVEASSFQTLEALAAEICAMLLKTFPFPEVTVSVEKPSALAFVESSGVEITRTA